MLKKKLVCLRNKILKHSHILRPSLERRPRVSGIFASGGALLIFAVLGLSSLTASISSSKQILGEAVASLEYLEGRDLSAARTQFAKARSSLEGSQDIFIKLAVASPLGENLEQMLEAGSRLANALELLKKENNLSGSFTWDPQTGASSPEFYGELFRSRENWLAAQAEIRQARGLLGGLPLSFLPDEMKARVEEGLGLLGSAEAGLDQTIALSGILLKLLGGETKTYLLIFQNNNEARATGGFIGTYGLLDLGAGVMRINKIESIYALDGQLRELIAAPGPLQWFVTPHWGMRDSNWFADFPASGRKILQFLEKENGVTADGIISFTPDFFEQLLEITGPVAMPEYGEVLTAENFRSRAQYKTSIDYDRVLNQPKKFLSDFAPKLLSRLAYLNEEQRIRLTEIFLNAIAEKHLLIFSLDPELEAEITRHGAGGEIKQTPGDFLAIIHSNAGGGKTDQGIEQNVEKIVRIDTLGRQVVNLKITRTHKAANELYFPRNVDFMRIFVPQGSKIIRAMGFDSVPFSLSSRPGASADSDLVYWDSNIQRDRETGIYVGHEAGHTVFMDWLHLDPGQSKTVELEYLLPQIGKQYSLLLQKQPGAREFNFRLAVQGVAQPVFSHPQSWVYENDWYVIEEAVDQDRFYAIFSP